jgi:multidrug efflux system outer membrane protein
MARAAFGAVALALLAGCSFIPAYERPAAPVPEHFDGVTEAAATPLSPWRDYYTNPSLQVLIEAALDHNRDLRSPWRRSTKPRAGEHRPRRAPTLDVQGSGNRSRHAADLTGTGQPIVASRYAAGLGVPLSNWISGVGWRR